MRATDTIECSNECSSDYSADYSGSDWITSSRARIDTHLDKMLGVANAADSANASPVMEAMRYSVLAPGKRIRPLLTLAVTEFFGGPRHGALQVACAIEMIHAASLILDDLPCMDNDSERRNRLATHARFGESLTILAAVSLLTHSCCSIASYEDLRNDLRLQLVRLLCDTVGPQGLSLGQYIDLHGHVAASNAETITDIHHLKTGVLFLAAARAGCVLGEASAEQTKKVMRFTTNIGLAFQLLDDLKDRDEEGTNIVAHIGISNAQRKVQEYLDEARSAVEDEENAEVLLDFMQAFFRQPIDSGMRGVVIPVAAQVSRRANGVPHLK